MVTDATWWTGALNAGAGAVAGCVSSDATGFFASVDGAGGACGRSAFARGFCGTGAVASSAAAAIARSGLRGDSLATFSATAPTKQATHATPNKMGPGPDTQGGRRRDFFACVLAALLGAADILFTLFARTGASSPRTAGSPSSTSTEQIGCRAGRFTGCRNPQRRHGLLRPIGRAVTLSQVGTLNSVIAQSPSSVHLT